MTDQMLRVAVPNKGALSESAAEILAEAGYRRRRDPKDLTVVDPGNNVEFFFLRPKDIAIYVGSGQLDLGITGRDLAADSDAPVRERLSLGFGNSTFRYAAPAGREWTTADLAGKRIATSFPNLVRKDLAAHGIDATVIRLDAPSRSRSSSASPTSSPTWSAPVARWVCIIWWRSAIRCASPRPSSSNGTVPTATRTQRRATSSQHAYRVWCSVSSTSCWTTTARVRFWIGPPR